MSDKKKAFIFGDSVGELDERYASTWIACH